MIKTKLLAKGIIGLIAMGGGIFGIKVGLSSHNNNGEENGNVKWIEHLNLSGFSKNNDIATGIESYYVDYNFSLDQDVYIKGDIQASYLGHTSLSFVFGNTNKLSGETKLDSNVVKITKHSNKPPVPPKPDPGPGPDGPPGPGPDGPKAMLGDPGDVTKKVTVSLFATETIMGNKNVIRFVLSMNSKAMKNYALTNADIYLGRNAISGPVYNISLPWTQLVPSNK